MKFWLGAMVAVILSCMGWLVNNYEKANWFFITIIFVLGRYIVKTSQDIDTKIDELEYEE